MWGVIERGDLLDGYHPALLDETGLKVFATFWIDRGLARYELKLQGSWKMIQPNI